MQAPGRSLSQQRAMSSVPIAGTHGCLEYGEQPSSSDGVSLTYSWGERQETLAVWATSPFWPLPLLPLVVSFPRRAPDRHGASAFYQAWDSRLPCSSLKTAGEPRKAEIATVQGLCRLRSATPKAQTFETCCDFQEKFHCVQ